MLTTLLLGVTDLLKAQYWPEPSSVFKPWARWWWPGSAVNSSGLQQNLEAYAAAGLGGLELTPIYGVRGADSSFIPYLSERWMEEFKFALKTASRLGLGMDMATGTGWPFGGPAVGARDASKNLVIDTFRLAGGIAHQRSLARIQKSYLRTVTGIQPGFAAVTRAIRQQDSLQAYAVEQLQWPAPLQLVAVTAYAEDGKVLDITAQVDAQGILRCSLPAGTSWKLYVCYMGWHGKWVERAAPGGEGNVIDHFQQQALSNYLAIFDSSFQNKIPKELRAFYNDSYEVDDGKGQSDWSPDFFAEFKHRRGYDLRLWIRALQQEDEPVRNVQVLADFRLTISELLLHRFTETWAAWARKQHKMTRSQAHGSPANILDLYAAVDIPEGEGEEVLRLKFASSAATVSGKGLVSGELATWLGDHFEATLADVQQMANRFLLSGINHLVYHGICYSPPGEPWPGWLFYAAVHFSPQHPFWNDFAKLNTYITRVQSLLQPATAANDLLLYYPFSDFIRQNPKERLRHFDGMKGLDTTAFARLADSLQRLGYTFDFISDKQVAQLECRNGQLFSGQLPYKAILIPPLTWMPTATAKQLEKLVKRGASVILSTSDTIWAADHYPTKEPAALQTFLPVLRLSNNVGDWQWPMGAGRWVVNRQGLAGLEKIGISRETLVDGGLQFIRKKTADQTVRYFVVNTSARYWKAWTPFNSSGNSVLLRYPGNGRTGKGKLNQHSDGQRSMVYLELAPGESVLLDFTQDVRKLPDFVFFEEAGAGIALTGPWQLHFERGGPIVPQPETIETLRSWTSLSQKEAPWFSGAAVYRISFRHPGTGAGHFLLDLGRVALSASIRLNGKSLDTLIAAPYQLLIPANQLKENNILEITVSNGMQNRILYMENAGLLWKRFYNINFPARDKKNSGRDGLFTNAGQNPAESGLLGPVRLVPVQVNELHVGT